MLAHVFSQLGLQKAIEERVRFARARMGDYEVIDFVVMLLGYAVSGERTLQAFYERLLPFAEPFMALFGRANLPHPATLSRFLAALDQGPVEALRTLFQEDLVARSVFASPVLVSKLTPEDLMVTGVRFGGPSFGSASVISVSPSE